MSETIASEGSAKIHIDPQEGVFYNDIQQFNRDISILVIQEFIDRYLAEVCGMAALCADLYLVVGVPVELHCHHRLC
jgi:tRNA G26 N,N-dimethylase Trm1